MGAAGRAFSSFLFWGAWVAIPFVMEIVPGLMSAISLIRKRLIGHKPPRPAEYPEITLIIPVYNCGESLRDCIRAVHESTYDDSKVGVFLVNNLTPDNSFEVYADAQREFPTVRMQWLNARQGKSRALNMALYNSKGKYIINIDSDGFLEPHALQNLVDMFEEDPAIGCMTGAILITPQEIEEHKGFFPKLLRRLEFLEYARAFLAGRSYSSDKGSIYTLSGAFSAFRKSSVLKSRMYNTDTIGEDTHMTFQMSRLLGEKVRCCDRAIYFTGPIEGMDKLYTQRQRWQRGSLEVANIYEDEGFRPSRILSDVNVRTLMYDHTFAFPRAIWALAMACLCIMGYAGGMAALSGIAAMGMYVVVEYLNFISIRLFLAEFPETGAYYGKLWWAVPLLPLYGVMTFLIRFAGILNSMNTTSAWKTKALGAEAREFAGEAAGLASKLMRPFSWLREALNDPPPARGEGGRA